MRPHLAASVHRFAPMWDRRRRRPQPACHLLVATAVSSRLRFSGGEGSYVPSLPPSVIPQNSVSLGGHSGDFFPWGNSSTPGVSMPCGDSTPPHIPWRSPLGFLTTPEASQIPSLTTNTEDSPARFSCRPATLSLSPGFSPWRPPDPASSVASEVTN